MHWLILVAIAVVFDSIRIFIDNYTTDVYFKGKLANGQKVFSGYAHVISGVLIGLIFGFQFDLLSGPMVGLMLLSGVLCSLAGIFYYKTLEIEESTNLAIFVQLSPVLYLILGWIFFGESFSPIQLIAFAAIVAAPLLIILTTRKNSRKTTTRAVVMAGLYVLLSVVGNLVFVKSNLGDLSFTTTMAFFLIGKGISDLALSYGNPKWHKRYRYVMKRSQGKVFRPLFWNEIIALVRDFAYRGALLAAPAVALASATIDSSEPIVTFLLGVILTLIWPKFGREKLTKKAVLVHLVASILIIVGIVLLNVST